MEDCLSQTLTCKFFYQIQWKEIKKINAVRKSEKAYEDQKNNKRHVSLF